MNKHDMLYTDIEEFEREAGNLVVGEAVLFVLVFFGVIGLILVVLP